MKPVSPREGGGRRTHTRALMTCARAPLGGKLEERERRRNVKSLEVSLKTLIRTYYYTGEIGGSELSTVYTSSSGRLLLSDAKRRR